MRPGQIEIRLSNEEKVVAQAEIPNVEGLILGRSDSSSTYLPDIDLSEYAARDKGVSRRHAVLVRYRGMIHIVDLSSVNGTFLNGERLLPDVPYPVKIGDELSLANLNMLIFY